MKDTRLQPASQTGCGMSERNWKTLVSVVIVSDTLPVVLILRYDFTVM